MPEGSLTRLTPAEIFAKTRRIEIRTAKLVNELFGGRYQSTFKGRGMEFSDIREYVPGDDIRSIHWNVTARLGHPYVKRFTEERELTIIMAVDVSHSQEFGTRGRLKSELAAELVSLISFASLKNNDKVGLVLFSDQIEAYIPPRKSKSHTLRMVRDVLGFKPKKSKTNIGHALEYINRVQKKRAIVFIISDFLDHQYEKNLGITQKRHDTIAFVIADPMEQKWPSVGRILLEDAETQGQLIINNRGGGFSKTFDQLTQNETIERNKIFSRTNLEKVIFRTDGDVVKPLLTFFQNRARRLK